jgi:amino acid transporter
VPIFEHLLGVVGSCLLWSTLMALILTLGLSLSGSRHARRVAQVCGALAFITLGLGLLAALLGIIWARGAMTAVGLSASDQQRIWSNGVAEALYDTALALLVALPALLAARFALKRAPA